MIFVQKQAVPPSLFLEEVEGLDSYEQLSGERKENVIQILLAEQGYLCAVCERSRFGPTIEHFLPRSHNPAHQLDYFNLYVTCGYCNGPKADFLVPPFIFDRRFDPCAATGKIAENNGVCQKFDFSAADDLCTVVVPAANHGRAGDAKPAHHAAYILHYTLELMAQNRQSPGHSNLLEARGLVYKTILKTLPTLSNEKILEQWNNIINARTKADYRFPEFVSMQLQLLAVARRKRGI